MSSDTIAAISRALSLHTDETQALYRWAGRPVPPLLSPTTPEVPDDLRDQCAQWAEHWAPPLLAQLRQGALGNAALRAIVDREREDPQVRDLWERTADLRSHAYGTTRPMHLEGALTWVRIMGRKPRTAPHNLHQRLALHAYGPGLSRTAQLTGGPHRESA